jgi:hypothetical protein
MATMVLFLFVMLCAPVGLLLAFWLLVLLFDTGEPGGKQNITTTEPAKRDGLQPVPWTLPIPSAISRYSVLK